MSIEQEIPGASEGDSSSQEVENVAQSAEVAAGETSGLLIRKWRERRHLSQKELASAAGVSCRHVSFLETGRSKASRKMVLRLCEVLDLPYRARNDVLQATGYDPVFGEIGLHGHGAADISRTLDYMLGRHEPGPAVVLDGRWNVLRTNEAGRKLLMFLIGGEVHHAPGDRNLVKWLIEDADLRASITNWNEVVVEIIRRLHREIETNGADRMILDLLDRLIGTIDPDMGSKALSSYNTQSSNMLLPIVIKRSGMTLTFFAASTKFSGARDITMQELSVEALYPACSDTEEALKFLQISRL
jgi:transcriptional regulator with XRE-family HTH domain